MAEKLKIIPLGGLNEIGKNMTVYEYGGEIIVVDCGMAFPGDDMYGIDCVIPDISYLVKNHNRLRGLFSFEVNEGEIVTLIGANGAGKTTTMQSIMGFIQPKGGEILYQGQSLVGMPTHKIMRMGLTQVPACSHTPSMLRKRISCAPYSHLLKINFFVAICEVFLLTYAKYAAHRASCLSQK